MSFVNWSQSFHIVICLIYRLAYSVWKEPSQEHEQQEAKITKVSILETGNYKYEVTTDGISHQETLEVIPRYSLAQNYGKSLDINRPSYPEILL